MKTVIRIQDLVFTLPSRSILKGHFRFCERITLGTSHHLATQCRLRFPSSPFFSPNYG